jgi:hypothetical protein
MALSVIIVLYVCIGLMSAAGSVSISRKVFSAKAEQIFFGLFLVAIASFYLAFTAYFGNEGAWRLETGAVAAFAVLGVLGTRVSVLLIIGYVKANDLQKYRALWHDDFVGWPFVSARSKKSHHRLDYK